MSRPLRIEYKNAWYHVLNRGRRKEKIFFENGDYHYFLHILSESVRQFRIKIHAYSLMPNHYHLLVQTPEGNLSRAMRHINGVYTQKINKKHKYEGSLFKGRYKSILIEQEEYLLELVRYIHRNPFKAGLEKRFGYHKWTSHRLYMNKNIRFDWLTTDVVLSRFCKRENVAIKELDHFVKEEVPSVLKKRLESTNWPSVLGNDSFKSKVGELLLGKELSEVSNISVTESINVMSPSKLFDHINKKRDFFNKRDNVLFNGDINLLRDLCIRYCRDRYLMKMKDIGKDLDLSVPAISRAYRKSLNAKYSKVFETLNRITQE